jgi:hypothetical protein
MDGRRSPDVHAAIHVGPDDGIARSAQGAHPRREILDLGRVILGARMEGRDPASGELVRPPQPFDLGDLSVVLGGRRSERVVGRPQPAGSRSVDDESGCAIRMHGGEHHRDGGTRRFQTEQDGTVRSGGIHHRANVLGAALERELLRSIDHMVGHAGPSQIDRDQAAEGGKTFQERGGVSTLPDLGEAKTGYDENEIDRTIANELVGDMDAVVRLRVPSLWDVRATPPPGRDASGRARP